MHGSFLASGETGLASTVNEEGNAGKQEWRTSCEVQETSTLIKSLLPSLFIVTYHVSATICSIIIHFAFHCSPSSFTCLLPPSPASLTIVVHRHLPSSAIHRHLHRLPSYSIVTHHASHHIASSLTSNAIVCYCHLYRLALSSTAICNIASVIVLHR